jgi:hypothetical protein
MSHTVQDMMRHRNSGATRGPAHAVNDGTGNQGSGVLLNRFVPNRLVNLNGTVFFSGPS